MNNQQAKRDDRIKSAKAIFQEFYLTYQEKDDYWLVAIANQSLHYYPATGRWRLQDAKTLYYSRSALDFISKVYQRQKG